MFEITKEFAFEASHQLEGLPEGHKCSRLHGHSYLVVLVLRSEELDEVGFVRDYGELSLVKDYVDNTLDHRHLNGVLPGNPTAENIAKLLFEEFIPHFPELVEVRVSETVKTWAKYSLY